MAINDLSEEKLSEAMELIEICKENEPKHKWLIAGKSAYLKLLEMCIEYTGESIFAQPTLTRLGFEYYNLHVIKSECIESNVCYEILNEKLKSILVELMCKYL